MVLRAILIVDDEAEIRDMLKEYLSREGYDCRTAGSCQQALMEMDAYSFDAAILDVMLGDGDGFSLFSQLKKTDPKLPVLFLSARDEDEARLHGLGLGADDYITKPFLMAEVSLRLKGVLRRVYQETEDAMDMLGTTAIFWNTASVKQADGEEVQLTAKEFSLLKKLWDANGRIVTIDALCAALWDGELIGYENTLMVHIRRLREKIEPDPSKPVYLITVRGLGYRLVKTEK